MTETIEQEIIRRHYQKIGRLGGLARSEKKTLAVTENGRKGGKGMSERKTLACRENAKKPRPNARGKKKIRRGK